MYVCICVYVYMCICVYVYMCMCVYVYMCVYIKMSRDGKEGIHGSGEIEIVLYRIQVKSGERVERGERSGRGSSERGQVSR